MMPGSANASAKLTSLVGSTNLGRRRRCARTKRSLHQDAVDPAAEFEPDRPQETGSRKPERLVQPDRRPLAAAADHGNHLAIAELAAAVEEGREQGPADAATDFRGVDVNRIFEGEPIGRPCTVSRSVAVSDHPSRSLNYQIGQFERKNIPPAPRNLVLVRRNVLERGNAMKDVMTVDGGDFGYIVVAR